MVKQIKITAEKYALVDDEDFETLIQHKWVLQRNGYASRARYISKGKYKILLMHHVILPLVPGMLCDHIDRNPLNNTRKNLRLVTPRQSSLNRNKMKNCTSKYRGVHLERGKYWIAKISDKNGNGIYFGSFKNEEDAALAYNAAAKEINGEFAQLNEVTK